MLRHTLIYFSIYANFSYISKQTSVGPKNCDRVIQYSYFIDCINTLENIKKQDTSNCFLSSSFLNFVNNNNTLNEINTPLGYEHWLRILVTNNIYQYEHWLQTSFSTSFFFTFTNFLYGDG